MPNAPDLTSEGYSLLITTAAGREVEARREVKAVLPDAVVKGLFLKGNLLASTALPPERAIPALAAAQTDLLARLVPLDTQVRITPSAEAPAVIAQAALRLNKPPAGAKFLVECRRRGQHEFTSRDVQVAVGRALEEQGALAEFDTPDWLVAVEIFQQVAYLGIFPRELFVTKQLHRARKYAPGQRPLNRAQLKLSEIIERFGLELRPDMRALDLGAAPGGWTKVLAEHVAEVVAVDPADLDPGVAALSNVRHLALHAQELLERSDLGQFDLITNDMNRNPDESAALLCRLAAWLQPGGQAVMTIKFVTRDRRRHIRDATGILAQQYEQIRVRRMPHNAKEVTAVMRRRA